MHAAGRVAIVAGRPSAAKTPVDDRAVTLGGAANLRDAAFDPRCAGAAVIRTDVEVRQPAFEQEGTHRAYGVAVIENRDAVRGANPLDLRLERGVVGRVKALQPVLQRRTVGFHAFVPYRTIVEIGHRHQAGGVLAGIEALAARVAIGVDHIAVEGGAHRRRLRQQAVIEPVDVPVRIAELFALDVQPAHDGAGHIGAGMRKREDDRRCAARYDDRVHDASSGSSPALTLALSAPLLTSSAAASRSGAR